MSAQRDWFDADFYGTLGIAPDESPAGVTRAYRRLARRYHPDANPGDAGAEERFKAISAAYDVVGDPLKRSEYDELRRLGPYSRAAGAAGRAEDPFADLFGRGARPHRDRTGPAHQPGPDLEAELHLAFADAARGVTTVVNVGQDVTCGLCAGSGAAPGTSPLTCPDCSGRGTREQDEGFFSRSQPCRACRGTGRLIEHPCPRCAATGEERRSREVKVRVPPGVADGQRIRLAGRGGRSSGDGPDGDLLVTVAVGEHPLFGRRGQDLTLTVPLTYPEAVLGAEVTVPTLSDGPLTLRVPPGTRSGRTFRVRDRGIEASRGRGDLMVTVEVVVPTKPSAHERRLLEELAKLGPGTVRNHFGLGSPAGEDAGPAGGGSGG
jgi:molecular chaperone DnaJ